MPAKATPEPKPKADIDPNATPPPEDTDTPKDAPPAAPTGPDPLLSTLLKDMGEEVPITKVDEPADDPDKKKLDDEKPKGEDDTKKDDDAPNDDDKKDPDPEPKPEPKPKAKKNTKIIDVEPELTPKPAVAAEPPKAEAPKPEPKADPDAEYVAGLTDEQKEELAEADFAEAHFGEKYKGRRKKLIDFYKAADAKLVANPDLINNEEEFGKLMSGKPKMEAYDQRKVIRGMAAEEAERKVEEKSKAKYDELDERTRRAELQPGVASVVKTFDEGVSAVMEDGDDKDIVATVFKKLKEDPAAAAADYPLETTAIAHAQSTHRELAHTYTMLVNNLVKFDAKNEQHMWLFNFVDRQSKVFLEKGGKELVRDGRTFVPRGDPRLKEPGAGEKWWTFSNRQVMELLALNAKGEARARIEQTTKWAEDNGFARKEKKKAEPKTVVKEDPKPKKEEPPPVKATARPSKGAAVKPASGTPSGDGIDVTRYMPL